MKSRSIESQQRKIKRIFSETVSTTTWSGNNHLGKEGTVELLVVSVDIISTRDFFNTINLGCRNHNSWFLDLENAYDLTEVPETSYTLENVNITNTIGSKDLLTQMPAAVRGFGLHEKTFSCFKSKRPLTFHEVLNLAFQYPGIFNEKIHGIQAYGSRFTKSEINVNPSTDDTLEIYRKGNVGKGFLKLAREQYRYSEDTKIIPYIKV